MIRGTAEQRRAVCEVDWTVHGFTSLPTQYRLYGRRFLRVKRPNQQYQSTEGEKLQRPKKHKIHICIHIQNSRQLKGTHIKHSKSPSLHCLHTNMGWLGDGSQFPQRAGLPGLNGGGAAATVPPGVCENEYFWIYCHQHGIRLLSPHKWSFQTRTRPPSHHTPVHESSLEPSSTDFRRLSYTCDDGTVDACWTSDCPHLSPIHDSGLQLNVQGQSPPQPLCHPVHNVSVVKLCRMLYELLRHINVWTDGWVISCSTNIHLTVTT